jgi:hypothetical protein
MGLAGPLTDQQRVYLERLAGSGQHLLGLVADVLDLSKIEAGETRVARADGMTGPAVGAALDVVAPAAVRTGPSGLVDARPDEAGVPFVATRTACGRSRSTCSRTRSSSPPPGGTVTVTCETVRSAPRRPPTCGGGPVGARAHRGYRRRGSRPRSRGGLRAVRPGGRRAHADGRGTGLGSRSAAAWPGANGRRPERGERARRGIGFHASGCRRRGTRRDGRTSRPPSAGRAPSATSRTSRRRGWAR